MRHASQLGFAIVLWLAVLTACGGGGGSSTPPPPPVPLTIPAQTLAPGLVGKSYSVKLQATGGVAPYHWSTQLLGIGGLTLATDGTISGTPSVPGTFIPTFTVTDAAGTSVSAGIEIDIFSALAFETPPTLPDQNIALPVYIYISVNGGKQPYTFSLASGSTMPPGLTFGNANPVGLIQGTPTTPGSYSFTVQVTDSFSPPSTITQAFTLNVLNNLVLPKTSLPDAVQNLAYQEQILPAGGTPPYKFVLGQYSVMPPGLKLDSSTGRISGTPTTVMNDYLVVTITDSASPPAQINPLITFNVQPPLSIQTTSLPDSARGLNYSANLYINGGRAPYTAQVVSGALPTGVSLSPSPYTWMFNVTGSPSADGLFKFTIQVSDSYETPNTVTQDYQVRISDQMSMTGPVLAEILYNQTYSTSFPITGGYPPYTWAMYPVPSGFIFDTATGTLSGTPVGNNFPSSVITAQDSSSPPLHSNYLVFQLYVYAKLQILTSFVPSFAAGAPVWIGLQANGGAAPYAWSVSSGSLPSGMTLDSQAGVLRGTPTAPGTYPVTFAISDGNTGSLHQTTSQSLTLTVKDRSQFLRNDTLAQATPLSTISLLASISPYSDPSSSGPDIDIYSVSAAPGTQVWLYLSANNDFLQPPMPNSMLPVLEVVDANGTRYATCSQPNVWMGNGPFTYPCVNGLDGTFYSSTYFGIQVPGSGTAPVTFYIQVSDARGDARPDFIYTLWVFGAN